ncbi:MAG: TatD family hydrolase [Verrucomicrobiota bacterium]
MLTDTHTHFDGLNDKISNVIARAADHNVTRIIAVGGNPAANDFALETAATRPGLISPAIGLDRQIADKTGGTSIQALLADLRNKLFFPRGQNTRPCAIGEIGLDFHYSSNTRDTQLQIFRAQLKLAGEFSLPAIIHSRNAEDETLRELEKHVNDTASVNPLTGVLHCFTGSPEFARKLIELGYYISFSGIVTFKKAENVRAALMETPDNRLLIETDSPYLAPEPLRGKPNEPANVEYVARRVAEERGTDFESIARLTTENAKSLFQFAASGKNRLHA